MKFQILHESKGRVRLRAMQPDMSIEQADMLEVWLRSLPDVDQVTVHERIRGVIICFHGNRDDLYRRLAAFSYEKVPAAAITASGSRTTNRTYKEKLICQVIDHYARMLFLPLPLRCAVNTLLALPRIWKGIRTLMKGELTVDVLDGTALGVSLLTGDFSTAGSVCFLLGIGETLEEWTHKKSVADLAESMALQVEQVWKLEADGTQFVSAISDVQPDDRIVVHTGHVIPLDGILERGDVMVNQASLTGESVPVAKRPGSAVYAGSVIE